MNTADIEDVYELTPMQQGMFFHSLAAPNSGAYIQQGAFALRGNLNVSAFSQAWQQVADRHAILRTCLYWEDIDKPVQVVRQGVTLPLGQEDWRGLTPHEQEERLEAFLKADKHRDFDFRQSPLMRLALIQTSDNAYQFVHTYHHILLEGWSASLLIKEVSALYNALRRGQNIQMEPSRPYRDYITWLQQQDLSKAEAFWRKTLKGFTSPTPLRVDKAPVAMPSQEEEHYDTQQIQLSVEATTVLKSFAQEHHLTLNTLVKGAWACLLSRYSGEEEVVFGSVVSGRPATLAGAESIVGLFVNTLPMRVKVASDEPLLSWLSRLQAQQVEMLQYEYSPLEKVQRWSDVTPGVPLFKSILAFQNWPGNVSLTETNLGDDLEVRDFRLSEGGTGYPLAVEVTPGSQLLLGISYDCHRLDPPTITRMLDHFRILLEGFATNPGQKVSELPLLTETERQQLLVEWNTTRADYPRNQCIHQLFEAQVQRTPDAVAVVFEDGQLTYQELNARANQLAHRLQSLGVCPDVPVAIFLERGADLVVSMLAVLKSGGAYVPLDTSYPKSRIAFMLRNTGAKVLLTRRELVPDFPEHQAQLLYLDSHWPSIAQESQQDPSNTTGPEHLAYIMYTSGSTGLPKGIQIPHQAVVRLVSNTNYICLSPADRVAQASNASFDASTFEVWGALLNGATLVGIPKEVALSPTELAAQLREQRISVLFLTTALFNQIAQETPWAFGGLDSLLFGGEVVNLRWVKAVLTQHAPKRLLHVYGPTESTTFATFHLVEDVPEEAVTVPIGRPIANTEVYILDSYLQPVPIGVPGELYIGGDGLARGYLNQPELTAAKFPPNPFSQEPGARLYKTGDLVRSLPNSDIEFLGRIDNQVKIRGFRIELGEIETVLGQHPALREAVVVVREDRSGDKRLVAYVVQHQGQGAPTTSALRRFLGERLPDYMVPAAFIILDTLPLTPNGKVDRRALPEPDPARPDLEEIFVAPRTEVEQTLAAIWQEVLRLEQVGIHDNFFDLGGHSMKAVPLFAQIEKAFGQKLPLASLLQAPTVEQLAALLEQKGGPASRSSLVAIQPHGTRPPFFCIHAVGGHALTYAELAYQLGEDQPLYGLEAPGRDGEQQPLTQLEDLAAHYIKEVRTVQPEGPYRIGGLCLGGLVAFEMAQQLQAQGQQVALLALLDTPCPTQMNALQIGLQSLERLAYFGGRFVGHLSKLLQLGPSLGLSYLREKARNAQGLIAPNPVQRANSQAARRYLPKEPRDYPGRITFFLATGERTWFAQDLRLGWNKVAAGGVETHRVPGTHLTILREPHVQLLAQQLKASLDAAAPGGVGDGQRLIAD